MNDDRLSSVFPEQDRLIKNYSSNGAPLAECGCCYGSYTIIPSTPLDVDAENFPYFSKQGFFVFIFCLSVGRDALDGRPAEPPISRETLCRGRQKCAVKAYFMGNQSKCRWCRYSAAIRLRNQHLLQIDVLREKMCGMQENYLCCDGRMMWIVTFKSKPYVLRKLKFLLCHLRLWEEGWLMNWCEIVKRWVQ